MDMLALRTLVGLDHYSFLPQVQKIVDQWSHVLLDLIRAWLLGTRNDTHKIKVGYFIPAGSLEIHLGQ